MVEGFRRPNGLRIRRERVPLGVVGIIYEARPNVTSDAAALCLKAGNAVLLRGGKEAIRANIAIAAAIREGLTAGGLPPDAGAASRRYLPGNRLFHDADERIPRRAHPPGRRPA